MSEYHTVSIGKKYYQKIDKHRIENTIFDNTKAFILHGVANEINNRELEKDVAVKALEKIQDINDSVTEQEIEQALNQSVKEALQK